MQQKASTPQSSINELMVEYALQNKTVARLKGGDVSIFSNILDELQVLKENKIAYEIIPGVTAALGAAAYAGMPLTARGYATSVRFLTYYKSEILTEEYWKEIAETNDTLVFYMSVGNLNNLVDKFKEYSVSSEKKIAVIEQATTPFQKVYTSSFEDFAQKLGHKLFASPSLVVIGKIVNLHEEFSWLQEADREGLYFKSITNGSLLPKTQNFLNMLSETKLQVLKEISSGFSRDEAIWASGYLAGLAGTSAAVADLPPQQTTYTPAVKKITLVYGTETGNSKKLATEFAGVAKKKGIQVKLGDLSQYKPKDLAKEEYLFVVISTQGEGEPPILAKKFYDYIHENELNLSNIKFGVLALGDSTYPQFCKTGEDVDTRFEVLGAERIIPLKRCDIDYEEDAHRWLDHIFEVVQNKAASPSQGTAAPKASSGRKKYQGKVSAIINLNDITSDKETYHIEIETEEPIAYRPGDALGVIPFNPKSVVEEIIGLTGIDPENKFRQPELLQVQKSFFISILISAIC